MSDLIINNNNDPCVWLVWKQISDEKLSTFHFKVKCKDKKKSECPTLEPFLLWAPWVWIVYPLTYLSRSHVWVSFSTAGYSPSVALW